MSQKKSLDILGYSVTPYVFDYQSVTKTILYFTGPPFSLGFYVYTLDFQYITPHIQTFSRHVLHYYLYFTDKTIVYVDNNNVTKILNMNYDIDTLREDIFTDFIQEYNHLTNDEISELVDIELNKIINRQ